MAQLVVMYKTPKDAAAFDKNYAEKHIPMAKKIPGLRKYEVSKGPVATPAGPSAYHLIATLTFDDLGAFKKRSAAPRGNPPRLTCRPSPPAAPRCSFSTPSRLEAGFVQSGDLPVSVQPSRNTRPQHAEDKACGENIQAVQPEHSRLPCDAIERSENDHDADCVGSERAHVTTRLSCRPFPAIRSWTHVETAAHRTSDLIPGIGA